MDISLFTLNFQLGKVTGNGMLQLSTVMVDRRIGPAASARADVRAFLFWARMPFAVAEGGKLTIGDQRFDNPVTRDRFNVRID